MFEDILPILVISAIISGVIGLFLGSSVNKGFAGFFLGLFLGPIGWIIVLLHKKAHNYWAFRTSWDLVGLLFGSYGWT